MKALCLYAGASTRLHPLTFHRHKAMLDVAGRCLVDYQLDSFKASGISDVVAILGHGADELERRMRQHPSDLRLSFIRNDEFTTKNLDYSLFLANSHLADSCIYFEGDMLVPPEVLTALARNSAEVCLALDSSPQSGKVDTLVIGEDFRPTRLLFAEHGNLQMREHPGALGELMCVMKLGSGAAKRLRRHLSSSMMTGPMQLYSHFEQLFAEFQTSFVDARGSPWIEIDTELDLQRAHKLLRSWH